jgi:hypothetical protein
MWVDKDDVFAEDKVREFKDSNPEAETHIRVSSAAKSPYPSALTRSHLLHQHASKYMSSDGNDEFALKYPAGAIADSPVPFSQEHPVDTPVSVPVPIIDFTTMQPLNATAPVFSPRPVTASSLASDIAAMFRGLCIDNGLIPMARPPHRISDDALDAENKINTAMGTLQSFPTHHSTSPLPNLDSQCSDPFQPMAWRGLTSIVQKPQRWQLASLTPLKVTKMPLRFRRPMIMAKKLPTSSQRGSESTRSSLPKGWVYEAEEERAAVKAEVVDPARYLMIDAPLTRSKRKAVDQLDDPHRRHCRASSITAAPHSSHSVSKRTAVKHQLVTSAHTSTLPTPL